MPSNVEIKARVRDLEALQDRVRTISGAKPHVISQRDTFFFTSRGRLKLRELAPDRAELIYYERPDQDGPKRSDFYVFETARPAALKAVLAQALGVRGEVEKTRRLYMVGQTRMHLDEVMGLGTFLELEVVLQDGQSDRDGQAIAEDLLTQLGVDSRDLVESAYMDLLEQGA